MTVAVVDTNEDLERLLRLAAHERDMRNSPNWKRDWEIAFEDHGEAVDALFDELYRQLDARSAEGTAVKAAKQAPNIRRELKQQMKAALRRDLPDLIANLINDL